jgi:hypothetical protein
VDYRLTLHDNPIGFVMVSMLTGNPLLMVCRAGALETQPNGLSSWDGTCSVQGLTSCERTGSRAPTPPVGYERAGSVLALLCAHRRGAAHSETVKGDRLLLTNESERPDPGSADDRNGRTVTGLLGCRRALASDAKRAPTPRSPRQLSGNCG